MREALADRRVRRAGPEGLAEQVSAALRPSLRPVLNATGVILHTNLGRAPLAAAGRGGRRPGERLHHPGMAARRAASGARATTTCRPTCGR